jgi:preprotein translocase subunit SecG
MLLYLLLILIMIASILLVIIILAQNPKGSGLSNIGAGASQFLGARQTADFLEKATWYFGVGILAVVVFTYFLTSNPSDEGRKFKTDADYTPPASAAKPAAPVTPGASKSPAGTAQPSTK